VALQLLCLDPFWYAIAAKTKAFSFTTSPQIFQFEALGNADTYPVITIENAAANPDFTLESVSGAGLRIQDAEALGGTTK
jgi:hypothetical protein